MSVQAEHATLFAKLHVKGDPLILVNIWDAGSAKAIQEIGAKAIATGSLAVAAAFGVDDGEKLPLDLVLANLRRIVESVDLPVTVDLESGYGQTPDEVQVTVHKAIEAGAIGINIEDQIIGGNGLYSIAEQAARLRSARKAADEAGIPLFINARTDIFLKVNAQNQTDTHLEDAIRRAVAFAEAGPMDFSRQVLQTPNALRDYANVRPSR